MTTARQIATETRMGIGSIAKRYSNKTLAFELVAEVSGVSASMVAKFYYKAKDNPSVNVLDAMTAAVRHIKLECGVEDFRMGKS